MATLHRGDWEEGVNLIDVLGDDDLLDWLAACWEAGE